MDSFRSSKFVVVRWYPKLEPCPNKAGGESFWPNHAKAHHEFDKHIARHFAGGQLAGLKAGFVCYFFCVHLEMSINGLLFLSQSFPWYASLVVATSTTNKRVEL